MSAPGLQGLRPWIIQRITAVYLAIFIIYFALSAPSMGTMTAGEWRAWAGSPVNTISLGLFLIATLWHAWIGVRDVILDYFPNVVARLFVLALVAAVLLGSLLWGLKALLLML
ncbi:MAG: succinate dehydrogenase, hydrophobic membrane anchor protein [Gammaproteobacteria bacterium]|nr:succinate dehydrogenase, hydrophobic membrane anchor protein [Gammaproteobacteria bacterium]MDH5734946.1 succinate dehydrogenase, hydrophobic membrane anchor protein [Gammaproteobacteria bacterium]